MYYALCIMHFSKSGEAKKHRFAPNDLFRITLVQYSHTFLPYFKTPISVCMLISADISYEQWDYLNNVRLLEQ